MIWNTLLALMIVSVQQGPAGPTQSSIGTSAPKSYSRGSAILASWALPGSGQMMLGSAKRGEAFMWADGALWAIWAGFTWASSATEHDARLFAAHEAGADLAVADPTYYKALEQYDNAGEYNEQVRADARDLYPDDPAQQHTYYLKNGYFGSEAWNWSTDSARISYYQTRRSSRNAALKAGLVVGGLFVNRLVSFVDCAFFAGRGGSRSRVELLPDDSESGIKVCYRF